jgi:hypothetical protein
MPRKSAHAELDRLRQDAAREAAGVREAEAALHRAEADRRALDREMEAAYFDGRDGQARQQAKRRATLDECAHQAELRLSAQRRRAQHADEAVARFEAKHARQLLAEMRPAAEQTARELQAALEHVVRLDRAMAARAPGGRSPRQPGGVSPPRLPGFGAPVLLGAHQHPRPARRGRRGVPIRAALAR